MYDPQQEPIESFSGRFGFLSNFSPAEVALDGIVYPTVEHAYQAAKTMSRVQRELIHDAKTPGNAKRFGRDVTLREDWEFVKVDVMRDLLRQKFADTYRGNMLLSTGGALLVEGNHWNDRFWGVCKGVGQNWLGRLLMEIRKDLKESKNG